MTRWLVVAAGLWIAAVPVAAQALPEWLERTELSVLFFGDAYWVAQNHDPELEGRTGFWIRRIYLTLDHDLSESLDFRLRFEAASPGDFASSARLDPFVKDAWVRWQGDRTAVLAGLAPTPTWAVVEDFWGLRVVEKSPLDLQRMGSSRELGVALQGSLDAGRRFRYHAMLGNGSGTGGETNQGKKAMLSLGYFPSAGFVAEVYGDFEERGGGEERATVQAFAGMRWSGGRAGLLVAHQERDRPGRPSLGLDLASAFAVVEIGERLNAFARVDRMFDPNPEGGRIAYIPFSSRAESTFVLAGVEVVLGESLSLVPNLETVLYDDAPGGDPETDVIPRLTMSLRF